MKTELSPQTPTALNESTFFSYQNLLLLTIFVLTILHFTKDKIIAKLAAKSPIDYGDPLINALATILQPYVHWMHRPQAKLDLPKDSNYVIAAVPHRTGVVDGICLIMTIMRPIRFYTTDFFDQLPLIKRLIKGIKGIPVLANAPKEERNKAALQAGIEAAKNGDCIAIFPEGAMERRGKPYPPINGGIAKIAMESQLPLVVIRLDGLTSTTHPWLPLCILNNSTFLSFFTFFLPNNVKITQAEVITDHIGHVDATPEEKREIMAQMIAKIQAHRDGIIPVPVDKPITPIRELQSQKSQSTQEISETNNTETLKPLSLKPI